ncbi:MAG: hypothetical protein HW414_1275 [Dehalococcoidia bacterium]|nr:hypothetical protein [Dehalococcoidia bacterium]
MGSYGFHEDKKPAENLAEFRRKIGDLEFGWVFRGQLSRYPLRTTLDRACENAGIDADKKSLLERELLRQFCRWYDGQDRELVESDTLYCFALMQHYGAPTRLLDWTYSPYVAAYFALEALHDLPGEEREAERDDLRGAVWCVNTDWLDDMFSNGYPNLVKYRKEDRLRKKEGSFEKVYMGSRKFVLTENPYHFHTRLFVQQGVFLCPGDVSNKFEENLRAYAGWGSEKNVRKIPLEFAREEVKNGLLELRRMNIYRGALFPGLDGFAKSMKYLLPFYLKIAELRQSRGQL